MKITRIVAQMPMMTTQLITNGSLPKMERISGDSSPTASRRRLLRTCPLRLR